MYIEGSFLTSLTVFILFNVWVLDHVCDSPGCKGVLIMDGNMKNARQVCMCKHVGELQFDDLQGTVVVGKTISY